MTLRLYNEALVELKELAFLAPEEPNVWFMLGRCNKALGNRGDAVKCFTSSLNLDAKVGLIESLAELVLTFHTVTSICQRSIGQH